MPTALLGLMVELSKPSLLDVDPGGSMMIATAGSVIVLRREDVRATGRLRYGQGAVTATELAAFRTTVIVRQVTAQAVAF
jgi:hypothetical protein